MSDEEVKTAVETTLSPEERRRAYNQVVRQANLVNILLRKVDFNVDREKLVDASKPELVFSGSTNRFFFDADKTACVIDVKWSVELKDGRKKVATCTAFYEIAYDGLTVSDESVLRIFADNVARSATYAYFRALFATLDWGADLRTPPLPVLKLFPKV